MAKDAKWRKWLGIHGSRLMLYARQQTRCEADAEDVLQNALLKTWRHAAAEQVDPGNLRGLIFTNIRRCAIDIGRNYQRRMKRDENFLHTARSRNEHVAWFEIPNDDDARQLQVSLSTIPEKYREVITLKIWGELTFAQIGKTLGISPNTAASRYRYGLESLRTRMVLPAADSKD